VTPHSPQYLRVEGGETIRSICKGPVSSTQKPCFLIGRPHNLHFNMYMALIKCSLDLHYLRQSSQSCSQKVFVHTISNECRRRFCSFFSEQKGLFVKNYICHTHGPVFMYIYTHTHTHTNRSRGRGGHSYPKASTHRSEAV